MNLKFLSRNRWSHGSSRRFRDWREERSSCRVNELSDARGINSKQNVELQQGRISRLHGDPGIAVDVIFKAGSASWVGKSSIFMSMNRKPGRMTVARVLNQCRALATLTGNKCRDRCEKLISYPVQKQIVEELQKGDRISASNLLQELGQMNHPLQVDDFYLILCHCARSPDPLFAMETLRLIDERKIIVDNNFCMFMVQALCEGGYMEEGLNMLQSLVKSHGLCSIVHVYNYFLWACAKGKDTIFASKCLDLMEQGLVGKNEQTYLALLKLADSQENWSLVLHIWKDYISHYQANIPFLRYFLRSFIKMRKLEMANHILQLLVSYALEGAAFGVKTYKGRIGFNKLDIPIPLKKELGSTQNTHSSEEVDGPGGRMGASFLLSGRNMINRESIHQIVKVLRRSFNDLILACAKSRDWELAEQLFQQMQNLGVEPTEITYNGFIRSAVERNGFGLGLKLLETMRMRNLEPRRYTLAYLSRSCSRALQLDMAEALLDQISGDTYSYPYNALLEACTIVCDTERGLRVFSKMKQAKVKPDKKTYELLMFLFGNVNPPYERGDPISQAVVAKRIKIIEADMAKHGVQHSSKLMKNLLRALGYEGMIQESMHYLRLAEDLFYRNNKHLGIEVYNTVLYSLTAASENKMVIELFKSMRRCGRRINDVTYNIMISCCSNIQSFRSATSLVAMMIRDGFMPDTITYTALIKILLDDKSYNEALCLLHLACSDGNKLDTVLFNTILKKAGEKGCTDVVNYTLEHMRREKVGPDPSTCSYVCNPYNDGTMTIEALQVLSVRMITQEGFPTAEERTAYEDFIFSEDPDAEDQLVHLLKDDRDSIAFGLLNLRWCAILGVMESVNWVPDESPWARQISASYDDLLGLETQR